MSKTKVFNGKTLKAQLFSAIAMMLIAAVALGTSTYAWFISNATPSVETMNFTASTATSLQLTVNAAGAATIGTPDDTKWKSLITLNDIKEMGTLANTSNYANFDGVNGLMVPATITSANLLATSGAEALPTSTFFKADEDTETDNSTFTGFNVVTNFATDVKMVPLYLRANKDMDVFFRLDDQNPVNIVTVPQVAENDTLDAQALTSKVKTAIRDANNDQSMTVTAPYGPITEIESLAINAMYNNILKSVRIAFLVEDATEGLIILAPDKTSAVAALSANTTDWNGLTPNEVNDQYTDTIASIYGADPEPSELTTVEAEGYISEIGAQTTINNADFLTTYMVEAAADEELTVAPTQTPFMSLVANAAKQLKVYIWLDGTDKETLSTIGSQELSINLNFIGFSTEG